MNDRTAIVAAVIIGSAIVAASFSTRARYSLSAAGMNSAWRMDTWSGQIDICTAAYLPSGPLVRCGAVIVTPAKSTDGTAPAPAPPPQTSDPSSAPSDELQPFPLPKVGPRDQASYRSRSAPRLY